MRVGKGEWLVAGVAVGIAVSLEPKRTQMAFTPRNDPPLEPCVRCGPGGVCSIQVGMFVGQGGWEVALFGTLSGAAAMASCHAVPLVVGAAARRVGLCVWMVQSLVSAAQC